MGVAMDGLETFLLAVSRLYLRHFPDILQNYTPSPEKSAGKWGAQVAFSALYLEYLRWLQVKETAQERIIYLTFYPIAKNIRHVGTEIRDAAAAGQRIRIGAGNDREQRLLEATKRVTWSPWLWSRIPRGQLHNVPEQRDDAALSWGTYFFNPNVAHAPPVPAPTAIKRPVWSRRAGSARERRTLELALCTWYAFRLNNVTKRAIATYSAHLDWPSAPVLAMHVRRGDASSDDTKLSTRPSWMLDDYMTYADQLCERYGMRTIYISTESESEIERAKSLRPHYRFLALKYDRSVFPTITAGRKDIEDVAFADPSIIAPVVESALADLSHIARCQAFIGTFNSEFSVLGWLLAVGRAGHAIPYVNLVPRSRMEYFQGRLDFRLAWLIKQFYPNF